MKKLLQIAIFILLSHIAQATVLVALDANNLNNRETAALNLLKNYGLTPVIAGASSANYDNLSKYGLIVATENGAINADAIDQLITNGKHIILFNNAGSVLGGTWNYGNYSYDDLIIEQDQAFFNGYKSNLSSQIQTSGSAYYIAANYPAGWTAIACEDNNIAYKTVLYREHASGGKGLIFTYNPSELNSIGMNFFDMAYRWLENKPAYPGITVPDGHVAFVISKYQDTGTPELTTAENALQNLLINRGYEITFLRSSRLANSDLSKAIMVAAAEYPSIDRYTVNNQLAAGKNVLLLHSAAATISGTWDYGNYSFNDLLIEQDQAFFNGYKSNLSSTIQTSGSAYYIAANYPAGWTVIASEDNNIVNKTVLYREHASGGKGLIFTYNPSELNSIGMNFFDMAYRWLENKPAYPGINVPKGHVAFVISNYQDTETPELTAAENALQNLLINRGYEITFIRSSRLANSDLSKARMVAAAQYPSIDRYTVNNQLAAGKNVLLLHSAAATISGTWDYGNYSYNDLLIEQDQAFLNGYKSNLSSTIQSSGSAYYIAANYPAGWTAIASEDNNTAYKTVMYREHASGGKGLIFTYNPSVLNSIGMNFFDMVYQWLENKPAYPGINVPEGHVAFVISNYQDTGTPELTTAENALQNLLINRGYEITFIRSSRLANSDLSKARMVAAAQYPSIDRYTVNSQLAAGKNVLLLHSAAATISGTWDYGNYSYNDLLIEQDQAFLNGYKSNLSSTIQSSGSAYYITANYPAGWTVIASEDNNIAYKTVMYREHASGGKGLIFTYNPSVLNSIGMNFFDMAYRWLENKPAFPGINVPEGHVAFVISNYQDTGTPELTTAENALQNLLINRGYEITFIRSSRLANSDLSKASFITAVEYPSIDRNTVNKQISEGKNTLLLHTSAASIDGNWLSGSNTNYRNLHIENNSKFLSSYDNGQIVPVQTTGYAYYLSTKYPAGWEILGCNSNHTTNKTTFIRNSEKATGIIFTYNPTNLTEEGESIIDQIFKQMSITVNIDPKATNSIEVYPNPFKNIVYIKNAEKTNKVTITNIMGQIVFEQKIYTTNPINLNTSTLPNGLYLIKIWNDGSIEKTFKMIKN